MKVTLIGPFPPPPSGTTLKNQVLLEALESVGVGVRVLNTLGSKVWLSMQLVLAILDMKSACIVISVSKNGRLVLIPYGWIATSLFKKKVVLMPCGGTMPEEISRMHGVIRWIYEGACTRFKAILVETKSMRERMLLNVPRANVAVQPNFRPRPTERVTRRRECGRVRVVYLGRLRERKGIFVLVDAIVKLVERDRLFVAVDFFGDFLAADKSTEARFMDAIRGRDYICYRGYLDSGDIAGTLSQYDILVFPTYFETEGFPGVLVDAAFAGLPVVATDIAHNSEIVEDGITGLLCRPNDAESLAQKIGLLVRDADIRRRLGESNWKISTAYDCTTAARKLVDVFRS